MGSGIERINKISDIVFTGKTPLKVAEYAKQTQAFAHDLARELDASSVAAEAAMRELDGHPFLMGKLAVKVRAWRVARHLREARELCQGISAEVVKFNVQFRQEFIQPADTQRGTGRNTYRGAVDL